MARLIYLSSDNGKDDERRLAESPLQHLHLPDSRAQEEYIQPIQRDTNKNRVLQKASSGKLSVSFESCKFENNKYGGEIGLSIIEIATPHVTTSVKNSVFYKNDYATNATVSTVT